MNETLELHIETDGQTMRLLSPAVGFFTCALARGRVLSAGESAGVLVTLGRPTTLVVPEGAGGLITSNAPERVHAPVGFGDVLYELTAVVGSSAQSARSNANATTNDSTRPCLRSPQSGRFYRRMSPGDPPLVEEGRTIADGTPVGLIEVMKTFHHVVYRAGRGLPERARVVRVLAKDGGDVRQGDVLLELEAAEGAA